MLPTAPYDAFVSGSYNNVPILVGFNAEEARALVDVTPVKAATFAADIERSFGTLPPPLMDAYPHATDAQAQQARLDFERDLRFGWDMWTWARLQSVQGRAYFYHFMQRPPFPEGSIHAWLGSEPLRRAVVHVRSPGSGNLGLVRGGSSAGATDG